MMTTVDLAVNAGGILGAVGSLVAALVRYNRAIRRQQAQERALRRERSDENDARSPNPQRLWPEDYYNESDESDEAKPWRRIYPVKLYSAIGDDRSDSDDESLDTSPT